MELIINKNEATPISNAKKGKIGFASKLGQLATNKQKKKHTNPILPGAADFVQWVAYDRMTYAAASVLPNLISYFSIPANQQGKTKMDTNLTQSQTFPAPNWLNVVGICVYFADNMLKQDISIVLNNFWLEFWCQEKIYVEGPIYNFPSTGGLTSGINLQGAAANSYAFNNGTPAAFNFYDVRLPAGMMLGNVQTDGTTGIVINGGQSFHVDLKSTAAAGTITLSAAATGGYGGYLVTVSLLGTYSRAVQ